MDPAHPEALEGLHTGPDHLGSPSVKIDEVYVCGAVFSAEAPTLQMLVKAGTGPIGLIESIAELGAGWLQTIAGPQACATLTVTWHEPCPAFAPQSLATAAGGGASALVVNGATTDAQLPCAYEGTASATETDSPVVAAALTTKATNLRYELDYADSQYARYKLVAGTIVTTLSGHSGDCTYSGQATFHASSAHGDQMTMGLEDGSYSGQIDFGGGYVGQSSCPSGVNPELVNAYIQIDGELPADMQSLKGSGTLGNTEWQWDLHAVACQPSLVPVCQ